MSDRHVRLSARVVLDLLAGKISAEQFQRTYGWHHDSERSGPNPFAQAQEHGQLITSASVEAGGDADDDWIEFRFGPPDPAAAPLRRRRLSSHAANPLGSPPSPDVDVANDR